MPFVGARAVTIERQSWAADPLAAAAVELELEKRLEKRRPSNFLKSISAALLVLGIAIGCFFGGAEYQRSSVRDSFDHGIKAKVKSEVTTSLNDYETMKPEKSVHLITADDQKNFRVSTTALVGQKKITYLVKLFDSPPGSTSVLSTVKLGDSEVTDYSGSKSNRVRLYRVTDVKTGHSIGFTWLVDKNGNRAVVTFHKNVKTNKWVEDGEYVILTTDPARRTIEVKSRSAVKDQMNLPEAMAILYTMKSALKNVQWNATKGQGRRLTWSNCGDEVHDAYSAATNCPAAYASAGTDLYSDYNCGSDAYNAYENAGGCYDTVHTTYDNYENGGN